MRLLIVISGILIMGVQADCSTKDFETEWAKVHGSVEWIKKSDSESAPQAGQLTCDAGYKLKGGHDFVFCDAGDWVKADQEETCVVDEFIRTKLVMFQGKTYNYTNLQLPTSTQTFPIGNFDGSYVITTNYTANKASPTLRVRVGLRGKAKNPVAINIQQSTESVGFELPMRVVGRGNQELPPLTEHTVELCPVTLSKDKEGKLIPRPETVQITIAAPDKETDDKLKIEVHPTIVQTLELVPGVTEGPKKIDDRESLVYRFAWPEDNTIDEVDVLIKYFTGTKNPLQAPGKGPDICAKVSIRSGHCPLAEMGINELTFTRQAFLTVSKSDKRLKHISEGFLVVIDVLPDDYRCRANGGDTGLHSRQKTVTITLTPKVKHLPYSYITAPILTSCFMVVVSVLVYVLYISPMSGKYLELEEDSLILDPNSEKLTLDPACEVVLPPFDQNNCTGAFLEPCKQVDMLGDEEDEESNYGGGPRHGEIMEDILAPVSDRSFSIGDLVRKIGSSVKHNATIIDITNTIGHCWVPVVIFLTSFDNIVTDITGNLKEYREEGNLDACYVNSRCAFPGTLAPGNRTPDISRVISNVPYLVSAICFFVLSRKKNQVMDPINAAGKGVKHDFQIFRCLAVITGLIGLASSVYHVCPNQSTSRIDMYFIQILLGYYSLKLYQSRVPDIREVYFAPAIVICVLSAIERVFGGSQLGWNLIAGFHVACTLAVTMQLFFMGKVTMNPFTFFNQWRSMRGKFYESRKKPEFKYQLGFFALAVVATLSIGLTAVCGMWTEHSMYNVVALAADIVIYLTYYLITKIVLRKEKLMTRNVVTLVASGILWLLSFITFFTFRTLDTSLSPAESRALNKPCLVGSLDGHDLWHCLSSLAILLTKITILMLDDDLISTNTQDTYF